MPDAAFDLERLDQEDGRVVVHGRWSGVRGMRFVRPTLVLGDRQVLATLDHKPWPSEADPWVAAFPFEGELGPDVALSVAPSVTVPLVREPPPRRPRARKAPKRSRAAAAGAVKATVAAAPPEPAAVAVAAAPAPARRRSAAAPVAPPAADASGLALWDESPVRQQSAAGLRAAHAEVDRLRASLEAAEAVVAERDALRDQVGEAVAALREARARIHELEQAARPERVAAALSPVEGQRDRALAQVEEAVRDREAALRTRDRMVRQLAEAEEQARAAEAHRDAMRAQRDELAAAYEALRRQVGDAAGPPLAAAPAAVAPPAPPGDPDGEPTGPIGVREVPAARAVGADLHRGARPRRTYSVIDVWAIRVLGTVAAVCFLTLLVLLLRVFVGAS